MRKITNPSQKGLSRTYSVRFPALLARKKWKLQYLITKLNQTKKKAHEKQTKSIPIRYEPEESRDIRTKTIFVQERIQSNKLMMLYSLWQKNKTNLCRMKKYYGMKTIDQNFYFICLFLVFFFVKVFWYLVHSLTLVSLCYIKCTQFILFWCTSQDMIRI